MFFLVYGIYGFFRVYAHLDTDISKFVAIFFGIALMIFNGLYAKSRSSQFVKRFKKEENKKLIVKYCGGILSILSFLFMFASALAIRKMRHFT
jgi:EamA domain-containing membrane protein RarD